MAEVGVAFVSIVPSARDFGPRLSRQVGGGADAAGASAGERFGGVFSGLASKVAAVGLGSFAVLGAKAGIETAAGLEQANVAFKTMLGSATKARDLMADIKKFAKSTPFELPEVVKGAKQLLAFGFAQEEVIETMRRLGDIASGVGVPVGQLVNVFGQVRTSGRLMGQDLLQFTSAGVPIIKALADTMGVAQSEIKGMVEAGKIGFPEVQAAIESLTDKGGQFGGLMQEQSKTLIGVWANFKDSINLALADAFKPLEPAVKNAITAATNAITDGSSTIKSKVKEIKDAIAGIDFSKLNDIDPKEAGTKLGEALITGLRKAIDGLGSLVTLIQTKIGDLLGKVDWVGLGIKAGPAALGLGLGLVTGIVNGIVDPNLWRGIVDNLPQVLLAVLTLAFLPAKVVGILGQVLGKIPFAGKFLEAILTGPFGINTIGGKIKGALGSLIGDIGRAFAEGFGRLRIPGAGIVTKVLDALKGLPGQIGNFFSTLWTSIGVRAIDLATQIGLGIRAGLSKVTSAVAALGTGIVNAAKGFGSLLLDVGAAIIAGLAKGISGSWSVVSKAITALINKIPKVVRDLLGIKSPSKVFAEIGSQIGAGLIVGIDGTRSDVEAAASRLVASPTRAVKPDPTVGTASASAAAGTAVTQIIYPQPGQSEREIGDASANRLLFAMAAS